MKKTSRPKIGAIFTIISGAFGILGIASYSIGLGNVSGFSKGDMPPFIPSIIFGLPVPSLIITLLALTGGIFALQRKRWRWAMAGAIAASLSFLLLGIPAIALIALSRDEFE